jgi:hypothetical protein
MQKTIIVLIISLLPFQLLSQNNFSSRINFNFGLKTGYEQSYYDATGNSFKAKLQNGFGINYYAQVVFYKHTGIEFELAGFYHVSKSDNEGNYYYPERMEIPWSIKLKGFFPFSFGNFNAGLGYYFPYIMKASYYYPRDTYSGIISEIGYDFFIKNSKLSIGPFAKFVYYFDKNSDNYFSIYYLLNISYKIF